MSAKYEVGQRVWVYRIRHGGAGSEAAPQEGTVAHVGRKLVTIDWGTWQSGTKYRIDSGVENGDFPSSRIRTDDERADHERRVPLLDYLRSIRKHDLIDHRISTDGIESIVSILREELSPDA